MRNMGMTDRALRLAIVAVIATAYTLGYLGGGPVALVPGAVALVVLITSLLGTCPVYMAFGVSTRRRR